MALLILMDEIAEAYGCRHLILIETSDFLLMLHQF